MTNKEKAREIAITNHDEYIDKKDSFHSLAICEKSAFEMAEWKDQQFIKILKEKYPEIPTFENISRDDYIRREFIKEIINKLFKEK